MVLARSVKRFHPNWPVTVVTADVAKPTVASPEGVTIRTLTEIGAEPDGTIAAELDRDRLLEAVRGPVLSTFAVDGAPTIFLDPRLRVVGPLDNLEAALGESEIVLVPQLSGNGTGKSDADAELSHGVFHPGVIAMRGGERASAVTDAWPTHELAQRERTRARERTAFQAWLDAMPVRFSGVASLESNHFVVGYWNLEHQEIGLNGNGLKVGGSSAALLDLGSFDPDRPHLLSIDHEQPLLSTMPVVAEICAEHAAQLAEVESEVDGQRDPWDTLPDGTPFGVIMRGLAGAAFESGDLTESVFTATGMRAFYDWLNEPAKQGSAAGLNRYHFAIWKATDQLRAAYPHLDGPDGLGYAGWLHVLLPPEIPMPVDLLPPRPEHINKDEVPFDSAPPWGVNVAGFFRSELGLGEAARLLIGALDAAKVPALPVQGMLMPPCRQGAEFAFASPDEAPFAINIICMNGDTIPMFARDAGKHFFERRYSIALWWWEVGTFPPDWHDAFNYLDEIWVASEHIYQAIAPVSPIPVYKVPMPVIVPRVSEFDRSELGMPEDTFTFLYVYDYHSTSARKNPVGLVRAFKQSFPPGSGASLVLKCINADRVPAKHEEVLVEIGDHPDIHVVDRYVSAAQKDAIVAACDCYVSLHRSEGFGLTPAEAMWLGKPVIATGYGGVMEFMTPGNSYLVDHSPAPVGPDAHPYPPDAIWADPDIDQAARLMRQVFDNQDDARALGHKASRDIRKTNSPEVAGAAMAARLQVIYERISRDRAFDLKPAARSARWIPAAANSVHGALSRLKNLVLRVLSHLERRATRYEEEINAASMAIERKYRAQHAETLAGFRRTRAELEDLRRQLETVERHVDRGDHRELSD